MLIFYLVRKCLLIALYVFRLNTLRCIDYGSRWLAQEFALFLVSRRVRVVRFVVSTVCTRKPVHRMTAKFTLRSLVISRLGAPLFLMMPVIKGTLVNL